MTRTTTSLARWKVGDLLSHRHNPELGPGRIKSIESRQLEVEFPESDETLRFAEGTDALALLVFAPNSKARIVATGEVVTVESSDGGRCRVRDGRELEARELWPVPTDLSPIDLLAGGQVGSPEDFKNRLDALRLERIREADGLGSFLGGRVHLFPHQLYAADRACREQAERGRPVRWLLADEVGLGKTVEACLIMNRLIHIGQAERTLVVAPDTLTVQWLGELWRKYHKVFVLLDDKRLRDIRRDYGKGMNPFDVHRRMIVSLERLTKSRQLVKQAVEAGIDLLVVDEAHRLRRPPGHPGEPSYRAVAEIAELGRHVLLLTATPLEDDAHGFFRLLQLLRPDELPEGKALKRRLRRREPLPSCTSATRRVDIGGLPPRVPMPVNLEGGKTWKPFTALEHEMRTQPAKNEVERRRKVDQMIRAMASPKALETALSRRVRSRLRRHLDRAQALDPRITWLTKKARSWARAREKVLIFVAHRETLEVLKKALKSRGRVKVGVFHEDLSIERRDIEVAQFRLDSGPSIMISTEAGGEGRNFEFCHRLVLFDLPWRPAVLEQRIGRLDRIGRTRPTEIVYFRPPKGFGRMLANLYGDMGIFEEPLGGLERELRQVAREIERVALAGGKVDASVFDEVLDEARRAHNRVREAAYHELHRDPYNSSMAEDILARVPDELDVLIEDLVVRAASRLGLKVEALGGGARRWLIALGPEALVDHLPGIPAGSAFRGTFDREEAVQDETLDFFASGHTLVEGILTELEEGPRGRVALLQAVGGDEQIFGLLALYKRGAEWQAVAIDGKGRERPGIAQLLTALSTRFEPVEARKWTGQKGWAQGIQKLAAALPEGEMPQALAAFRVRPGKR